MNLKIIREKLTIVVDSKFPDLNLTIDFFPSYLSEFGHFYTDIPLQIAKQVKQDWQVLSETILAELPSAMSANCQKINGYLYFVCDELSFDLDLLKNENCHLELKIILPLQPASLSNTKYFRLANLVFLHKYLQNCFHKLLSGSNYKVEDQILSKYPSLLCFEPCADNYVFDFLEKELKEQDTRAWITDNFFSKEKFQSIVKKVYVDSERKIYCTDEVFLNGLDKIPNKYTEKNWSNQEIIAALFYFGSAVPGSEIDFNVPFLQSWDNPYRRMFQARERIMNLLQERTDFKLFDSFQLSKFSDSQQKNIIEIVTLYHWLKMAVRKGEIFMFLNNLDKALKKINFLINNKDPLILNKDFINIISGFNLLLSVIIDRQD